MDLEAVTDVLLETEADLDLLERTIDGVHYWERVRFWIHRALRRELGLIGQAHSTVDDSKLETLWRAFRSLVVDSPFLAPPADLLVYGHSRRKRLDDGEWWDIYCDPLLDVLQEDYTYLERPHEGEHLTPPRTDDVRHIDFVTTAPSIARRVVPDDYPLSDEDTAFMRRVEDRFEAATGARPAVVDIVANKLLTRQVRLPLYRRIIDRAAPELAVLVVSYARETFVEACRERGVPVVELQHGVVSPYHLGYAYPGERTKRAFPDYFLSFGDFWEGIVDLPLDDDRVVPVGYPYLEQRADALSDRSGNRRQVVVVSQGTIGESLSEFAVAFAERNPAYGVVYKLHPGEYSRWRRAYPALREAEAEGVLRVVGETGPTLYELFAESSVQVGVYSTALYEGLAFDLETYVVDLQGAAYMDRLVGMGGATRVGSVPELEAELERREPADTVDTTQFFEPDAVSNTVAALERIREAERGVR